MRFFNLNAFWLLIPWALLPLLWFWLSKRADQRLQRFASIEILPKLVSGFSPLRKKIRFFLILAASFFAVFALARPQMGSREETVHSQGLDLVFLLDVSNSMLTEDVVPSRLKKAKHVIKNFSEKLSGDRIGIVTFAGSAYPAVPMTSDYSYVRESLDILDEKTVTNQGTDIGKAIEVAMELIERGGLNDDAAGSAALVLLSDGEDHEGSESMLVDKIKGKGIKVFSIGVGTEKGGPIPLRDGGGNLQGYKRSRSNEMVVTKLETKALESIASKTSGKYYTASSNEGEVDEILSELNGLDRTDGVERKVMVYDEVYQYPLLAAVLLLLLAIGLREFASVASVLVFILCASNARADSSLREYHNTKKGLEAYEEKDFATAIDYFSKSQASNPEAQLHHLNLGDALMKSGAPERAIAEFEKILSNTDPVTAAKGAYNLGKALEASKKQEEALDAYQRGLALLAKSPKPDADTALKIKRAMEQNQQQQNQKGQQDQNQDSKDGKDGEKQKQDQKEKQNDKEDEKKGKDPKDENEKKKEKQYQNPKPQFKPEKLSEADAKKILKQLQEQEKQTQQRVLRGKMEKAKDDPNAKDW